MPTHAHMDMASASACGMWHVYVHIHVCPEWLQGSGGGGSRYRIELVVTWDIAPVDLEMNLNARTASILFASFILSTVMFFLLLWWRWLGCAWI